MINKYMKQTGNILLTTLFVLLGLYVMLIHYTPGLIQSMYKELGWALIIANKHNYFNMYLQIIVMVVVITIGVWYGNKKEKKGWHFWMRFLSIAVIFSFMVTALI